MRKALQLTQREFCSLTGIPLQTLSAWERGTRIPPDYIVNLLRYRLFQVWDD
nr:MAG TPA: hypothetical protein [Podoviridae sp. ctJ6o53]DAL25877.1 MAG TPA_asm: helix-turn-helix domain protein [Caudoviricetes sp.]